MIFVAGSTGQLGGEICHRLVDQCKAVRGLVRTTSDPDRVAALNAMGVDTVLGDLREPATLTAACRGVTAVITTATAVVSRQPGDSIPATDEHGQLNLVEAARQARVEQFTYISISSNIDKGVEPCPMTVAKRTVERAVMECGMTFTILRPSYFMEVWLSPRRGFDFQNAKANIYGDGHARISFISRSDVARFAVESLDNPAARNAVIELGGPQAVSWLEAVCIFEQISGKHFELQFIPTAALQAKKDVATDPQQASLAGLMLSAAIGDEVDIRPSSSLFSFPLSSVAEYARQLLG
jgi:uncharacterized protein YbjT (DUF2867 family)